MGDSNNAKYFLFDSLLHKSNFRNNNSNITGTILCNIIKLRSFVSFVHDFFVFIAFSLVLKILYL